MDKKWTLGLTMLTALAVGVGYGAADLIQGQLSVEEHVGHSSALAPAEAGQSAFAATAEIVTLLSNDPQTDWSKVNIAALRQHLVDMNALFLEADVSATPLPDGWRYQVAGAGTVVRAIQAMVPAHAVELDKMDNWSASARKTTTGAELTVTSSSASVQQKIEGLGFFGLMATGAHHQPHHLAMATGKSMHH